MKLLLCTDTFYPGVGGTELACFELASELTRMGHEVLLACPEYHRPDRREYPFRVLRLPSLKIDANDMAVAVGFSGKKIREMLAFSPDAVLVQTYTGMARIGEKVAKKLNVPVVMTVHTKLREAAARVLKSRVLTDIFVANAVRKMRGADEVVTVAECMRRELVSYGFPQGAAAKVIRNGATFEKEEISDKRKEDAKARIPRTGPSPSCCLSA